MRASAVSLGARRALQHTAIDRRLLAGKFPRMSSPETQHAARGWLASRVVQILAGPLLLLAVLVGLLGWQVQHLLGRMGWVEETCQAIAQGNALHRLLADQESSLRGYLLTQDRAVLDPFYARRTEIGPALSTRCMPRMMPSSAPAGISGCW